MFRIDGIDGYPDITEHCVMDVCECVSLPLGDEAIHDICADYVTYAEYDEY